MITLLSGQMIKLKHSSIISIDKSNDFCYVIIGTIMTYTGYVKYRKAQTNYAYTI